MARITVCIVSGILSLIYFTNCNHVVIPQDISPDFANGNIMSGEDSPSGVISELAGTEAELYAVGLNSGIWKSDNEGRWFQLQNSPRYSSTITVSPVNSRHIVVGEHDGEAEDPRCNRNGLWESFDSGNQWQLTWMSDSPDSDKRNIKALTFTPLGTVLFAAGGSIYRRTIIPTNSNNCLHPPYCYDSIALPPDVIDIKALSVSRYQNESSTWIVWGLARSSQWDEPGKIIWSLDDGQTWNAESIPKKIGNLFLTINGINTITGYRSTAIFPCKISYETDASIVNNLPYCCKYNTCMLLYFSLNNKQFRLQIFMLKPENDSDEAKIKATFGDGTGLGGRQKLRTFTIGSWTNEQIGKNTRIFYNVGQEILSAKSIKETGIIEWECIAVTQASGKGWTKNPVHPDIWDIHYDPVTQYVRLASDGGVFKKKFTTGSGDSPWLEGESWVMQNSGLHTQHVHNLVVLDDMVKTKKTSNIAYVTHDNDAWYRDDASSSWSNKWKPVGIFGDADCVDGDQVLPNAALLWRIQQKMTYTDFGKGRPQGATATTPLPLQPFIPFYDGRNPDDLTARCDSFIFPRNFRIIQTMKDQPPQPLLDAAILIKYPLYSWSAAENIPVLSPANTDLYNNAALASDSMILLRNTVFLANPEATGPDSHSNWNPVAPKIALPTGTNSVWVSNGHKDPVYYLLANEKNVNTVWKMEKADGNYTLIQLKGIGSPVLDFRGGYGKIGFGPLYVDPYDPEHVFVLTTAGIMVSPPGEKVGENTKFNFDYSLTRLITESVTYSRFKAYWGGQISDAYIHSMATSTYAISGVAFSRDKPHHVVVASPVAGMFVSTDDNRYWLSLNEYLPGPFTQIAAVAIEGDNAYAAFEGRGIWRFMHYENCKAASFFDVYPKSTMSRHIYLLKSDLTPLRNEQVSVRLIIGREEKELVYMTDNNGWLKLPDDYYNKVLHLTFEGNEEAAACRVSVSPDL